MNALSICATAIRLNDGLYSLNDLHKAAGNEAKQQPALFMRLDTTQAMIAEIGNSTDSQSFKITTGRKGGTYVCRELVYAYAMWISPKFSLEVIRAFDAQHAQPATKALPAALPPPSIPDGTRILITIYADGRHITENLPNDKHVISITDFMELLARANPKEVINAASKALNRLAG